MKKVLLFLFLLVGFFASGQKIQKPTAYGIAFNRTGADTLFYLPSDTFSVPATYNTLPFMARKGTSLYLYNTSTKVWNLFSSGGSGTVYVDTVYNSAGQFTDTIYQTKNGTNTVVKIFDREDGLVSGGVVTWDSLLVFSVSPAIYYIDGVRYTSPQTYITLNAADGSNPRIDLIAFDATGAIKVTGTAAASPAEPQVTAGQIRLTSVLVNAGATTPAGVSSTTIYDENTEWTGTATGVTANFGGTTNPFHFVKTTDVSSFTNGQSIKYTNGADVDITDFTALRFYLRLKATFANSARLQLAWMDGATVVSNTITIANGDYGFNRTTTGSYQPITIPISDWAFSSASVDALRITLTGTNASGFYIDYIQLTGGVTQAGGNYLLTSDTASMLSPYIKDAGWGLVKGTQSLRVDSNLVTSKAWLYKVVDSLPTGGSSRFAVEDDEAAENRNFNGQGYSFIIDSTGYSRVHVYSSEYGTSYLELDPELQGASLHSVLSGYQSSVNVYPDNAKLVSYLGSKTSLILTRSDSLVFQPHLGRMSIDTLEAASNMTNKKVMVWDENTKRWQQISKDSVGSTGGISNVKNSIEIDVDSAQLVNDELAPGNYKVYGTDSTGVKGYQQTAIIDFTDAEHGDELWYDTTGFAANGIGTVKTRTATGGCGDSTRYLNFTVGDIDAPDIGDSTLTHSAFASKRIIVYREGVYQHTSTTAGIEVSGTTITFHPDFDANDRISIEVRDSACTRTLTLEDIVPPPCTVPSDFDFDLTDGGVTESPANQWNCPANERVSNSLTALTGDGFFQAAIPTGGMVLALDASSALENWSNAGNSAYNYSFYSVSGTMYVIELGVSTGSPTSLGAQGSNTHFRLQRTGSTVKLQLSTDGTTFSDAHTFTATTSATLYAKGQNVGGASNITLDPKECSFE